MPLGSLTYHFDGLDDLLAQAFHRHAERMSPLYEAHFDGVRDRDGFIDAVTDLIHDQNGAMGARPQDAHVLELRLRFRPVVAVDDHNPRHRPARGGR